MIKVNGPRAAALTHFFILNSATLSVFLWAIKLLLLGLHARFHCVAWLLVFAAALDVTVRASFAKTTYFCAQIHGDA